MHKNSKNKGLFLDLYNIRFGSVLFGSVRLEYQSFGIRYFGILSASVHHCRLLSSHILLLCFFQFSFSRRKNIFFPSEIEIKKIFSFSIVETHCLLITTMCCTNDGYTYLSTYTYLIGWSKCYFWASFNKNFVKLFYYAEKFQVKIVNPYWN